MKLSMTVGSDGSATLLFVPENVKDGELIGALNADLANGIPPVGRERIVKLVKGFTLAAMLVTLSPSQPFCPLGAVCSTGCHDVVNNSDATVYLNLKDGCFRLAGIKGLNFILEPGNAVNDRRQESEEVTE